MRRHKQEYTRLLAVGSALGIVHDLHPCSVIASVNGSEPKQSILFLDKNGLLLTANRRSRNDPRRWAAKQALGGILKNILATHFVRCSG